jgi:hypothetical protein
MGRCVAGDDPPADSLHSPAHAFDWAIKINTTGDIFGTAALGAVGRTGCLPCARRHLVDELCDLPGETVAFGTVNRVALAGDRGRPVAIVIHEPGGRVSWLVTPAMRDLGCGAV